MLYLSQGWHEKQMMFRGEFWKLWKSMQIEDDKASVQNTVVGHSSDLNISTKEAKKKKKKILSECRKPRPSKGRET